MAESILSVVVVVLFLSVFLFAIGLGVWIFFSMARDVLRGKAGRQPLSPSSRRNLRAATWLFTAMGLFLIGIAVNAMVKSPHHWQKALSQLGPGVWSLAVARQANRERKQV